MISLIREVRSFGITFYVGYSGGYTCIYNKRIEGDPLLKTEVYRVELEIDDADWMCVRNPSRPGVLFEGDEDEDILDFALIEHIHSCIALAKELESASLH